MKRLFSINKAFNEFLFGASEVPLGNAFLIFFRISVPCLAMIDIFSLSTDWHAFFGQKGTIIPQELSYLRTEYFYHFDSFFGFLKRNNLTDLFYSNIVFLYVASLVSLGFGFLTRISAFVCLITQLTLFKSFPVFNYGYDQFMTMSLFYCLIFPVGRFFSVDQQIFKIKSSGSLLPYRRILQVHLCVVYFFSGIAKSFDPNWWNGNAIWRATASFYTESYHFAPIILCLMSISVILLEVTYPIFVNIKRTRNLMIIGVFLMHIGIGLIMELFTFASIMLIWNLTAFLEFDRKTTHPKDLEIKSKIKLATS